MHEVSFNQLGDLVPKAEKKTLELAEKKVVAPLFRQLNAIAIY